MKIEMSKRKGGIYAQWFEVLGYNENGNLCRFLIYYDQAKNYAQAVNFWYKNWGKTCKPLVLMNAEPYGIKYAIAC